MSNYGIRIGKQNKSAKSTNILDKNVDNDFPFLKAFKQGSASVNVTGPATYTVDVSHGLGYYPVYVHMVATDPANPTRKSLGRFGADGGPLGQIGADSYVTREVLHLGWMDTSTAPGSFQTYPYKVTFYYYIFYEPLE